MVAVGDVVIIRTEFTFDENSDDDNTAEAIGGNSLFDPARFDALQTHIEIIRVTKEGLVHATLITSGVRRVLPA